MHKILEKLNHIIEFDNFEIDAENFMAIFIEDQTFYIYQDRYEIKVDYLIGSDFENQTEVLKFNTHDIIYENPDFIENIIVAYFQNLFG